MSDDWAIGEQREFYPHYCLTCNMSYITGTRLEPCRYCRSKKVINPYCETFMYNTKEELEQWLANVNSCADLLPPEHGDKPYWPHEVVLKWNPKTQELELL